ncbi:cache domain-containing sensor histidine kinase [Metabacillus malikii]|uniref:histidine kinase n=1 Tax=Metabacillus malikii TaxID=1504265 RepID=A0ABT9ZGT5_9BACI|nr:sensor histidine kinase [Metabacillus malikii]MDQ0230748.1 two-component system sensor histidine kinase YesM [Metabacillus malikii]
MKDKLNDIKLRNKLIFAFIFVVFVPVVIVGGYLTNELRKLALDDAKQEAETNMERVTERTMEVLKIPFYISNNLIYDQRLMQVVKTDYKKPYDVVLSYREFHVFHNYRQIYHNEIKHIKFYTENDTLLNNWQIIPVNNQIANTDWYKTAINGNGFARWLHLEDDTNHQHNYLSYIRKIDFVDFETKGVLVIQLKPSVFNLILSQESQPIMLVDEENHIISSNQREYIGNNLHSVIDANILTGNKKGVFQGIVGGKATHIFVNPIQLEGSLNQLKLISIIEDESIAKNANMFRNLGLIVVIFSFCIALLFIYYLSKVLTKRLSTLSHQINKIGNGNFNTHIFIDGKDEIGQLSKHLNIMVTNIKQLLHEVYESNRQKTLLERKQNEIKFKMMASQINPHFLFNSLESIRMKANIKGDKEIARIVKLLGKLMRNSIEVGSRNVKLSSEMEVVKSYLEIQKFRHGDRLNYEMIVDDAALDIPIPPLIIQPLVENAVIHGVENNQSGGSVLVKAVVSEAKLIVSVSDNGTGISVQKRQEIYQVLNEVEEKEGTRIGLRNVHQRLQLTYGNETGLTIQSNEHEGTKVSFFIPIKEGLG